MKSKRKARGWSQQTLAEKAGISQPAVKKIEDGTTSKSRHMPKIAQVLEINLSDLDPSLDPSTVNHSQEKPYSHRNPIVTAVPGGVLIGDKDLPVHGTAQGGRGALIVTTEPVEWVARPQPLDRVKDGYGIIISENSMEPEFQAGDIALVHPHKPAVAGRTCIFYAERPDGTVEACIKRLRRETPTAWLVTQFNPPRGQRRDFTLLKAEWQKAHMVVGSYKGR